MKNKQAEIIKHLTDKELLYHLLMTQLVLLIISLILGVILVKDLGSFFHLFNMKDSRIVTIGIPAGLGVVLLDLFLMKLLPAKLFEDGGINKRIFENLSTPMLFFIPLIVAISEEILFRGVIQTYAGLIWASIIFAAVHYRYLFNWFLFMSIILLSFFIGYLFEWTDNLFVTIMAHFLIDFILGLTIKYNKKSFEEA